MSAGKERGLGKVKGIKWGRNGLVLYPWTGNQKDRTKAKAQPLLKGYKKRKKR